MQVETQTTPRESERVRHTGHGQSSKNHGEMTLHAHPTADPNSPHPADRKDEDWDTRPLLVGVWGRREVL